MVGLGVDVLRTVLAGGDEKVCCGGGSHNPTLLGKILSISIDDCVSAVSFSCVSSCWVGGGRPCESDDSIVFVAFLLFRARKSLLYFKKSLWDAKKKEE